MLFKFLTPKFNSPIHVVDRSLHCFHHLCIVGYEEEAWSIWERAGRPPGSCGANRGHCTGTKVGWLTPTGFPYNQAIANTCDNKLYATVKHETTSLTTVRNIIDTMELFTAYNKCKMGMPQKQTRSWYYWSLRINIQLYIVLKILIMLYNFNC